MQKYIVFTGGGTAGHVTPNLPLINILQKEGWQIDYIGSKASIEEGIIKDLGIPFHAIYSGKLRRYFSWKNIGDVFKIFLGIIQAYRLLGKLHINIVFSKGGFVAFPVVVAAYLRKIPIIAHESDMTPGLANRLSFLFANKICLTFSISKNFVKQKRQVEITGTPIREELFHGSRDKGLDLCGFKKSKPCLLVMGGGQGSIRLNRVIRENFEILNKNYQIIHLCGKGNILLSMSSIKEYCQFEYVSRDLPDLFAMADIVISRAGANSVYEILALKKPHIFIPLSKKVSRGDQIENAEFFRKQGISYVIDEDKLNITLLMAALDDVRAHSDNIIKKIQSLKIETATTKIISLIKQQVG